VTDGVSLNLSQVLNAQQPQIQFSFPSIPSILIQQPPPENSGSIFGNSNVQQPPQQNTGSMFGNSNVQQPPQQNAGSIFGNSNVQQPPQQNVGSIFGNSNVQKATGLFGNSNIQKPTGLFGNSNVQNSGNSSQNAQSGSSLAKEGQPKQDQPNQGQPKQDQPNQGQPKQHQPNQGQPKQHQPKQGQPKDGHDHGHRAIQIFVKTDTCRTVTLDVHPSDLVGDLREEIGRIWDVPWRLLDERFSMTLNGKIIPKQMDGYDLAAYGIQPHSTVFVNWRHFEASTSQNCLNNNDNSQGNAQGGLNSQGNRQGGQLIGNIGQDNIGQDVVQPSKLSKDALSGATHLLKHIKTAVENAVMAVSNWKFLRNSNYSLLTREEKERADRMKIEGDRLILEAELFNRKLNQIGDLNGQIGEFFEERKNQKKWLKRQIAQMQGQSEDHQEPQPQDQPQNQPQNPPQGSEVNGPHPYLKWDANGHSVYGVFVYDDGRKFEGTYAMPNGHGSFIYGPKGDKFTGHGSFVRSNGDKFTGSFINGVPHGHGLYMYKYTQGEKLEGYLIAGSRISKWYQGDFKEGKQTGFGLSFDRNAPAFSKETMHLPAGLRE
jgi:hypothetical protein